jgi:acyl-CoA reductase-like NAD-dependent aldehyde dehydrogenase
MNPHDRESAVQTITKRDIDGAFEDSHGGEGMDLLKPATGQVIARATLANQEDTRHRFLGVDGLEKRALL